MNILSISALALAALASCVAGAQLRDVEDIGVPEETPVHTRMFRSLDESSSYLSAFESKAAQDASSWGIAIGVAVPCVLATVGAGAIACKRRAEAKHSRLLA